MKKEGLDRALILKQKRGQVAIFVIIAILILAALLVYFFFPQISKGLPAQEPFSPITFLRTCIQGEITPTLTTLGKQGGYMNPEGFLVYQGEKIKYLCYVSGYYKTCVVQQPMIKNHVEQELGSQLDTKAKSCISDLVSEYKRQGYSVSNSDVSIDTEIAPHKISLKFIAPMTISKTATDPVTFKEFDIDINSEMYDLLFIAQSVVDFEATYGDSETTSYIQYYPDLKMEKLPLSDGSKIYTLTNVVTKEEFRFASRSLVWPSGYGLG